MEVAMDSCTSPVYAVLTDAERDFWNREGYLHLTDVLSKSEIETILAGVDVLSASDNKRLGVPGNHRDMKVVNAISVAPVMDCLLDHPKIFGKILSLMGPYLQIGGTEIMVRQPHDKCLVRFHTDGGASLRQIFPSPHSLPLHFKVQFFLTDVVQPDSGNFSLIPGSHIHQFPDAGIDWDSNTSRIKQVLARAGDAIIFPWSLWHGVAPNKSGNIRKSAFVRYSQLWTRPVDYDKQSPEVLARLSPRQRRLFGDFGDQFVASDYYRPTSKHRHLETILGAEWGREKYFERYADTYEFFKQLEDWKWDR
jgi:hypothetical protein